MRVVSTRIALAALLLAAAPLAAQDNPWASQSFLTDYTLLKPVSSVKGQEFLYVAPGIEEKVAPADSVMVDQPEIVISKDSPYGSAKPDDLKAIAEFTRTAIVDRIKRRGFKVVDQAGPNVVYLRVAITDLQLKKKKRGILTYTPVGAVVHGVASAVQGFLEHVDILDMSGQAELSLSQTGELLGELATRPVPKPGADGGKPERMTFDQFRERVDEYSDRLACRLDNSRQPADRRVDCTDPTARMASLGAPPAK